MGKLSSTAAPQEEDSRTSPQDWNGTQMAPNNPNFSHAKDEVFGY